MADRSADGSYTVLVRVLVPVIISSAMLLSGCGSPEQQNASDVAEVFAQLSVGAPAAACTLLAAPAVQELEKDGADCPAALVQERPAAPGELRDVRVSGRSAIAHLDKDTYFLALYDSGWKVIAAACTGGSTDQPYDCKIDGN